MGSAPNGGKQLLHNSLSVQCAVAREPVLPEEGSAVPERISKQKVRLLVAQTDCLRLGMRRNYGETEGYRSPGLYQR
jgi:hypothetical protein